MNAIVRWFLERVLDGRLPDPRTGRGLVVYGLLGLAVGFLIGGFWGRMRVGLDPLSLTRSD